MKTRTLTLMSVAALAGAALFVAAPSLLARGSGGGGRGTGDAGGDINGGNTDPGIGGQSPGTGQIGNGPGDQGNGIDGDTGRDGAEQDRIARDAVDGRSRADFRRLCDARNRRAGEPGRDASRR